MTGPIHHPDTQKVVFKDYNQLLLLVEIGEWAKEEAKDDDDNKWRTIIESIMFFDNETEDCKEAHVMYHEEMIND